MLVTRGLGRPGGLLPAQGLGRVLVVTEPVVTPSDPGVITWTEQFWLTQDGVTAEPGGALVGVDTTGELVGAGVSSGSLATSGDVGVATVRADSGELSDSDTARGVVRVSGSRGRATVSGDRGKVSTHADSGRLQGES